MFNPGNKLMNEILGDKIRSVKLIKKATKNF